MKNYFNLLKKSVWVVSALCLFSSCNDAWNEHYSTDQSIVPDKNLVERMESVDGSENFINALKTTKMFNGNKIIDLTYYDFLSSDQFLTVWMPSLESISEDEWAKYTKADKTYQEHKEVSQQFIKNHIARYSYPVGANTDENVRMLSKKRYPSTAAEIAGVEYKEANLACTNGILHLLDGKMPYRQTIYEYITETEGYKDNVGAFLEKYTIDEVDDNRSVISGVDENGEPIYIDSVTYKYSIIMNEFGRISEEDSNYVVVLPTPEVWAQMYDSVKKQFDYTTMERADSLQEYYTHVSLFKDMFFNMNIQRHPEDSVMSTLYYEGLERVEDALQHKYYNPYSADGIFRKYVVDSVVCSNGMIYLTNEWAYDKAELIDRPIKIEGEDSYLIKQKNHVSFRTQIKRNLPGAPKVSNEYVMQLGGEQAAPNYDITYNVFDNMKGKYKVGIVTVRDAEFPNPVNLPVQFLPTVSYGYVKILEPVNQRGRPEYQKTNIDKPIDTLWIPGVAEIPQANYGQEKAKLEIKLSIKEVSSTNNVMFLDCIIFMPVPDDYVDSVEE